MSNYLLQPPFVQANEWTLRVSSGCTDRVLQSQIRVLQLKILITTPQIHSFHCFTPTARSRKPGLVSAFKTSKSFSARFHYFPQLQYSWRLWLIPRVTWSELNWQLASKANTTGRGFYDINIFLPLCFSFQLSLSHTVIPFHFFCQSLSTSLSTCLLFICFSPSPSLCLPVCLSFSIPVSLSVYLSFTLQPRLFVFHSAYKAYDYNNRL